MNGRMGECYEWMDQWESEASEVCSKYASCRVGLSERAKTVCGMLVREEGSNRDENDSHSEMELSSFFMSCIVSASI